MLSAFGGPLALPALPAQVTDASFVGVGVRRRIRAVEPDSVRSVQRD